MSAKTSFAVPPLMPNVDPRSFLSGELALKRTRLANERTNLACLRTGRALVIAGLSLINVLHDYVLMLRTELAKLAVHGFEGYSVQLCFEAKMADAALELERFAFGVSQHGG